MSDINQSMEAFDVLLPPATELERLRAELAEKCESLAYYQKRYSQLVNALKCPQCGSKYFFALTADTHWCCENCKHTWQVQESAELAECRGTLEAVRFVIAEQVLTHEELTLELAECRRLLRKHEWDDDGYCPECVGFEPDHDADCPWKKAMGEQ